MSSTCNALSRYDAGDLWTAWVFVNRYANKRRNRAKVRVPTVQSPYITKTNENTVLYTNCIVKYHFLFPDRYTKREKCFETFNSCRHLMHGLMKLVTFLRTIISYQTPDNLSLDVVGKKRVAPLSLTC